MRIVQSEAPLSSLGLDMSSRGRVGNAVLLEERELDSGHSGSSLEQEAPPKPLWAFSSHLLN